MNTKPDDHTLALWLDDELEGEPHAQVEAWATDHPEQLAAREEIRRWRKMISDTLPTEEAPPAGEFFNERIQHAIRQPVESQAGHAAGGSSTAWHRTWVPMAACAGMALAFWLGMQAPASKTGPQQASVSNRESILPVVYTPEEGVQADYFTSAEAGATVIVLNGVHAIPDSIDFSTTAATQRWHEIDSTAANKPVTPPTESPAQADQ